MMVRRAFGGAHLFCFYIFLIVAMNRARKRNHKKAVRTRFCRMAGDMLWHKQMMI
jgi:heme/copper-type cytochrome/quinol oxidase subunit 3